MGTFEKLGLKQVVKTTEETLTIDSDHQIFRLLSKNELAPYREIYRFMHIGLVQVEFKPFTLRGLPESFITALRDSRNQNWKKSLIGTIHTTLAYGPVYFNAYPNLQISLQDENSLSSLMLNVKLHGYDYLPRSEVVCICYRIYYKLLHSLNPMCRMIDFKNETILIETNFGKSMVVTRRPIQWDEIDFPHEWLIEGFTGQLKDWWDNYVYTEQRDKILQAIKQEGEQHLTKNIVYTLVHNIIEHFSGRWSDNSKTIRTMLQNLRCKTLTSFRFYKDVFLSRVMELPECNSSHWKSKFIDGLPALFVERVRKTIRGDSHSINYDNYTYGKLIIACIPEGLSLCNEIKLN
ncbi:hypothetical protein H5410_050695 [Solanum commersonii]|uniref:DUF7746 domain-containing protein n=1 Tax=Solanum commersonii TaxID=4109 RepID=A0A9J5WYC6_SOLCO|nr:hypothetical protein H5410_050695 [Solanum commersonii]